MLTPGNEAPVFELPLFPGEAPLRLEDYRGSKTVVLLFFPLAFSPVCRDELCSVRDIHDKLKAMGAEVLGVSVDSPFVNRRFAEEIEAEFPILSDFNKDVSAAYGVLNQDYFGMRGVSYRSAFVIDPTGAIVYSWMTEDDSIQPNLDDISQAVANASNG